MPKLFETPVISFRNVTKVFPLYHYLQGGFKNFILHLPTYIGKERRKENFIALKDISFEIHGGETFGIIGRNGAGKSTTLGLIAGVIRPTAGEITISGRISPLLELGTGFHPDLTGRENIFLNGILLGLTRREVTQRYDAIVDFSELGSFINSPMRSYSSGMYMRLGFSVAVHTNPEILLVDEVLAVGDAEFEKKCISKMHEFKDIGVTIVFVSHDMDGMRSICDRVALIEGGKLAALGSPEESIRLYRELSRE